MENKEQYILTMTPEQARIVETACELLARLEIGQFNTITETFLDFRRGTHDFCQRRDAANAALEFACGTIFGLNSYGRPDCQKGEIHHRAWSVYAALRYARSWHEHPEGGYSVCFDKPMALLDEPLPKCEIRKVENK